MKRFGRACVPDPTYKNKVISLRQAAVDLIRSFLFDLLQMNSGTAWTIAYGGVPPEAVGALRSAPSLSVVLGVPNDV
jgi:hypothetical protein